MLVYSKGFVAKFEKKIFIKSKYLIKMIIIIIIFRKTFKVFIKGTPF